MDKFTNTQGCATRIENPPKKKTWYWVSLETGRMTNLVTGEVVGKLDHGANTGTVHSLAVHPARSFLVSAQRGSVTVWQDREKYEEDEEEEVVMSSANAFDMPPHWLEKHPKAVR